MKSLFSGLTLGATFFLLAFPAAAQGYAAWYCPSPAGYYPYVAQCFTPWQRVVTITTINAPPPVVVTPPQPVIQPVVAPMPVFFVSRDADDRQLNTFAVEFSNIDFGNPVAAEKFIALQMHIENYRQALLTRNYYVADIIRDTENLQRRMQTPSAPLPHQAVFEVKPPPPTPPGALPPQPAPMPAVAAPQSILPPSAPPPIEEKLLAPDAGVMPTPQAAPLPPVIAAPQPEEHAPVPVLLPDASTTSL